MYEATMEQNTVKNMPLGMTVNMKLQLLKENETNDRPSKREKTPADRGFLKKCHHICSVFIRRLNIQCDESKGHLLKRGGFREQDQVIHARVNKNIGLNNLSAQSELTNWEISFLSIT